MGQRAAHLSFGEWSIFKMKDGQKLKKWRMKMAKIFLLILGLEPITTFGYDFCTVFVLVR